MGDEIRCAVCGVLLTERDALDAALRLGDVNAARLHLRASTSPDDEPRCLQHGDVKITAGVRIPDRGWGNT